MLTKNETLTNYFKQEQSKRTSPSSTINRLLTAAVINEDFCNLLLTDPGQALTMGYQGELFRLDRDERNMILSIQANSLKEFALKIISYQEDGFKSRREKRIVKNQSVLVQDA